MSSIKLRIKELLIEKNMTQKQLAELTGLREATISDMANNSRSTINKDHLIIVMKALAVTDINRILVFTN